MKAKLLPKPRRDDVAVMDNLRAAHDSRVKPACAAREVRVVYLPPYSPDFNPIESGLGASEVSTHVALPRASRRHFDTWRDAHAIASRNDTVGTGSLIAATQLNPPDLWD